MDDDPGSITSGFDVPFDGHSAVDIKAAMAGLTQRHFVLQTERPDHLEDVDLIAMDTSLRNPSSPMEQSHERSKYRHSPASSSKSSLRPGALHRAPLRVISMCPTTRSPCGGA